MNTFATKLDTLKERLTSKHHLKSNEERRLTGEDFVKNFATQIINYRKENNYTQQEVAKQMKISQSRLSRIEKANWNPTIDTLFSIINNLGGALEINIFLKGKKIQSEKEEQEYI